MLFRSTFSVCLASSASSLVSDLQGSYVPCCSLLQPTSDVPIAQGRVLACMMSILPQPFHPGKDKKVHRVLVGRLCSTRSSLFGVVKGA